jgi:hypothetical protein
MTFPRKRADVLHAEVEKEDDQRQAQRGSPREGLAVLTSGIIDAAVGLTLVFGITAALASAVTELFARLIGLRGAYLVSGLRELVDGGGVPTDLVNVENDYTNMKKIMLRQTAPPPARTSSEEPPFPATGALLGGPILSNQGVAGQFSSRQFTLEASRGTGRLPKMTAYRTEPEPKTTTGQSAGASKPAPVKRGRLGLWSQRRSLPSYISSRSFADAVIDLLVPNAKGQTTMTVIENNLAILPSDMPFKQSLDSLVTNAGDDITRFRTSVEQWYDDHMDRVSGWYKRYVAIITVVFGAILIVLLNLNALTMGRTLYTESAVGAAISAVADKAAPCSGQNQDQCLANLETQLSALATAGLPIGWGTVRACSAPNSHCNWWDRRGILSPEGGSFGQLLLVIIGFLIMIIAIVPGAQFWFGLLTKLNTLRATGPKPTTPASSSVNLTVTSPPPAVTTEAAPVSEAGTATKAADSAEAKTATDAATTTEANDSAAADNPADAAAQSPPQPEHNPPPESPPPPESDPPTGSMS